MSEEPAGTLSKHGLREIPTAPKIDPDFKRYIEELYRVGRCENFEGMITIVFTDDGLYTLPHLGDVDREKAICALYDAIPIIDDIYE